MADSERNFLPLLTVPAVPVDGKMRFLCEDAQVELNEKQSTEVSKILSFCNGQNNPAGIALRSNTPIDKVEKILKELEEEKIIVDARQQFRRFHATCCNFFEIVSRDGKLDVFNRLHCFVAQKEEYDGVSPGYYELSLIGDPDEEPDLTLLSEDVDVQQLLYALNKTSLDSTLTVIVIAAEFDEDLTNRDYRSLLVEAGRSIDVLEGVDANVRIEHTTDFLDEALKKELGLGENVWPLVVIFAKNAEESDDSEEQEEAKRKFTKAHAGEAMPVFHVSARTFEDGAFFGASAMFNAENGCFQFSGATSTSYHDAMFKATAEGYERWQSGRVRVDYFGPANRIDGKWADPRIFAPLTREQSEHAKLKRFTKYLAIPWTKGENYDGTEIYVPSDLVYYGQKPSENPIYRANSSGVAAHFFFGEAKIRAVTELIERDAIMRCWFSQTPPNIVDKDYLPIHARKRIQFWKEKGFHVRIHQLDCVAGAVFLATITGTSPAFVSGAGSTLHPFESDNAIIRALDEAEYNLLLAIEDQCKMPIDINQVVTPGLHGRFYHLAKNATKLDWLLQGKIQKDINLISYFDLEDLYEDLELITIDLARNDEDCPFEVVRVLSPNLVPISFSVNLAHYTHKELNGESRPDAATLPHFFS